jgi:hypothetical protein
MPINDAIQAGIRCIQRSFATPEPTRMIGEAMARLKARKTVS